MNSKNKMTETKIEKYHYDLWPAFPLDKDMVMLHTNNDACQVILCAILFLPLVTFNCIHWIRWLFKALSFNAEVLTKNMKQLTIHWP